MRALRASRDRPPANLKPMHPAVTRALMLMRQETSASSLSDLAAEAGVAAPYLSRLLVEHTGRSFVDWRNRIRLDRFIYSYRPGANLLTAAMDAGFGSYTRFHHIFTEIIGCPPSEWMSKVDSGEFAPNPGVAAPAAGYGMPTTGLLSARQRWTPLAALVSRSICALLGEDFADRVLAATPAERLAGWEAFDDLEVKLSAHDIERFLASLVAQDPDTVADYALTLATHDLASAYASLCHEYRASPSRLTAVVAGLLMVVWVATKPATMNKAQGRGIKRQVERALSRALPRLDATTAREAYVAMLCQHVVVYRAAIAARSSGDPRLFDQLGDAIRGWCIAVLGRDICDFEVTHEGFVAPAAKPAAVRPRRVVGSHSAALSLHH
jgi:AraC-like DNA-binding protein